MDMMDTMLTSMSISISSIHVHVIVHGQVHVIYKGTFLDTWTWKWTWTYTWTHWHIHRSVDMDMSRLSWLPWIVNCPSCRCCHVRAIMSSLSCLNWLVGATCLVCPVPDAPSWLLCPGCPATLLVLSWLSCHGCLSRLSCRSCPGPVVLSPVSLRSCLVHVVMFWPFCHLFLVLEVLAPSVPCCCPVTASLSPALLSPVSSLLACSAWPPRTVLAVLFWLSFPGFPFLVICPGCPVPVVLSWLSYPSYPVHAVIFWPFCSIFPILAVLTCPTKWYYHRKFPAILTEYR